MLSHGILEAEINLCQGRIPISVFIRHYWSPKLKELVDKTLKILDFIETSCKTQLGSEEIVAV